MKYLIVRCEELNDGWECDADRTPVCMTDDPSPYGRGYEVYELQEDGFFEKVKDYEDANAEGMALYRWNLDDDMNEVSPEVLERYPCLDRSDVTLEMVSAIAERVGFEECEVAEILHDIHHMSAYGEEVGEYWVVFGRYADNYFDCAY